MLRKVGEHLKYLKDNVFHSVVYFGRHNGVNVMVRGTNKLVQIDALTFTEFQQIHACLIKTTDKSETPNLSHRTVAKIIGDSRVHELAGGEVAITHHPMGSQFMCAVSRTVESYQSDAIEPACGEPVTQTNTDENLQGESKAAAKAHADLREMICGDFVALSQSKKGAFSEYEIRLEPLSHSDDYSPYWGQWSVSYNRAEHIA